MIVHLTGAAGLPLWAAFGARGRAPCGRLSLSPHESQKDGDRHPCGATPNSSDNEGEYVMDQGRSDIGQDVRDIYETRNAISHKLKLLEQRVQEAAQGTKSGVRQIVGHIRHTAKEFVDGTTQKFDPIPQVCEH